MIKLANFWLVNICVISENFPPFQGENILRINQGKSTPTWRINPWQESVPDLVRQKLSISKKKLPSQHRASTPEPMQYLEPKAFSYWMHLRKTLAFRAPSYSVEFSRSLKSNSWNILQLRNYCFWNASNRSWRAQSFRKQ